MKPTVVNPSDNPWRELAMMTGPCSHGKVLAWDIPEGVADCPDCDGTGQKPLIPGLLEACPHVCCSYRHASVRDPVDGGRILPPRAQCFCPCHDHQCPVCGGADWVLVSGPEAMVAAIEYIWSRGWQVMRSPVSTGISGEHLMLSDIEFTGKLLAEVPGTDETALAQALKRALEKHD